MHSKVIIASLVCMLAASFSNGKAVNVMRQAKLQSEEISCAAPNGERYYFTVSTNYFASGSAIEASLVTDVYFSNIVVKEKSHRDLAVSIGYRHGQRTVTITTPGRAGDYSVTIQARNTVLNRPGPIVGTIYIYSDGTNDVVSTLSRTEARSLHYKKYAPDYRREALWGPTYPGGPDIPDPIIVEPGLGGGPIIRNAMKSVVRPEYGVAVGERGIPIDGHVIIDPVITQTQIENDYASFAYGSDDVDTSYVLTPSSDFFNRDTRITVHAQWYDGNGTAHPLQGLNVGFFRQENKLITLSDIGSSAAFANPFGDRYTDANGEYSISCTFGNKATVEEIDVKFAAKSRATIVKDGAGINYPYIYHIPSNINPFGHPIYGIDLNRYINNYAAIDYYVDFYPCVGDRAAAYEIAQAQNLPHDYTERFIGGLDALTTKFPAPFSFYDPIESDDGKVISIQKEDAHNWDVLNHEYGHYICDEFALCELNAPRKSHLISEDLAARYGEEDGLKLAYSEGLATYLGIASQMYGGSNLDVEGVGDEIYEDAFRNVYVDYNEFNPTSNGLAMLHQDAVEASVTSLMIKLLDNVVKIGDTVALGDSDMCDIIQVASWFGSDLNIFIEAVGDWCGVDSEIATVILNEGLRVPTNWDLPDLPNPNQGEWTILMYMLDGGGLSVPNQIDGMLSAAYDGQPSNIKIVIETNCDYFESYGDGLFRYCISNGGISMCGDPLPADNMGKQDTFEEFLAWGLDNYPAKKTGVTFFDHGRGIQGVCFDTYGMAGGQENPLLVTETSRALDNVLTARGIDKLEFVGYDACLMQLQDVAEFNSRYFNYMIGSEEEELAESMWAYDAWLPLLFANEDTLTILKGIADGMVDEYMYGNYDEATTWEQHLSVLDLRHMEEYHQRFEELAGLLLDHKSQGYTIATYIGCSYYGQWSRYAQPLQHGMVDCVQYLNVLKREYNTKAYYGEIPSSMAEQVVTKIDAVLSVLLNDARRVVYDDYSVRMESDNGLVRYFRASYGKQGTQSFSHGLAIHVYTDKSEQVYPAEETHFNNWRNLFL